MSTGRGTCKLARDVAGLDALGARSLDDFFADPPTLVSGDRAQRAGTAVRLPLPGTPDEHGRQRERPRGAGTGWLYLHRYAAGGLEAWRARLTHPRSTSRGARHWNLICHLQANGIAAPQLVALGERDSGALGAESFVVTRELDGFVPVRDWLRDTRGRAERRRGLRSLGLAFAQLFRCGAWLPRTTLGNLRIQVHDEDCVALKIVNLQSEQGVLRERGLVRTRLPAVAFTQFDRGRILASISARRRRQLLTTLEAEAGTALSARERREFASALLGGAKGRRESS